MYKTHNALYYIIAQISNTLRDKFSEQLPRKFPAPEIEPRVKQICNNRRFAPKNEGGNIRRVDFAKTYVYLINSSYKMAFELVAINFVRIRAPRDLVGTRAKRRRIAT